MSGAGQHTRASSPACGGRRARGLSGAAKALFNAALAVVVVCLLICQPYALAFDGSQVKVQKHEAQAAPAVTPYAFAFIQKLAEQCEMTPYDFCTTICIMLAAATGYNPVISNTVYGQAGNAIPALKATGVWPSWDDLSISDQSSWGGVDNYHAAQLLETIDQVEIVDSQGDYVSLIEDEKQRFYEHMAQNSGNADGFDLGQNVASFISSAFGSVGTAWMQGSKVGTACLDILNGFKDDLLGDYGVTQTWKVNPSQELAAGSLLGNEVLETYGSHFYDYNGSYTRKATTDKSVSAYFKTWSNLSGINGFLYSKYNFFYDSINLRGKNLNRLTNLTYTVDEYTHDEKTVYYVRLQWGGVVNGNASNITFNINDNTLQPYGEIAWCLCYGSRSSDNMMPEYGPGDSDGEYPNEGIGAQEIGPESSWPSLFGDVQIVIPPEPYIPTPNPYNPDDITGDPEWQDGMKNDLGGLKGVNLQMLFPFCLLFDIELLANKILSTAGVAKSEAPSLSKGASLGIQSTDDVGGIPGKPDWVGSGTIITWDLTQFGFESAFTIDLWPLAVLIAYTRPGWQVALLVMLFTCTIRFWQGVITG